MSVSRTSRWLPTLRLVVQWLFLLWVIALGIRLALFVMAVERGATPAVSRPAGVEGFLPIGALASLKYWLVTGTVHPVHPAALVIFLAILLMSLLARKSFCSWLCPVGTISETCQRGGSRIWGASFRVWRWLDIPLRGSKYLLLAMFVKLILLDMPAAAVDSFLDAPYWAVSDLKMLLFFTRMSPTTLLTLLVLLGLSLVYRNPWCRYLCPYGALLGLAGLLSPFKIRRDSGRCSGCQRCSNACPAQLSVHDRSVVRSAECSGCLTCLAHCPQPGTLQMKPPLLTRPLPAWLFPAVALLLFAAVIVAGMVTGHWQSSLQMDDYRQLIPMLPYLSH